MSSFSAEAAPFVPQPAEHRMQRFRDEILQFRFRFVPSESAFRAFINNMPFPEVTINTTHPQYLERVGHGNPKDPIFQRRLTSYVASVSTATYCSDKFEQMVPRSMATMVVNFFRDAFLQDWYQLEQRNTQNAAKQKNLKPQKAVLSKPVMSSGTHNIGFKSLSRTPVFSPRRTPSPMTTTTTAQNGKTNLYVCGIPRHWSKDDLRTMFSQFGEILSVKLWLNRMNISENAGSGFVQFVDPTAAAHAVAQDWSQFKIEGMLRPVQVKYANSNSKQHEQKKGHNIYVSGLPGSFTDEDLHLLFSPCGDIKSVLVLPSKKGFDNLTGFVRFETSEAAYLSLETMDRASIQGYQDCIISCSWAKTKAQ